MANQQHIFGAFLSSVGKVNSPFRMKQRSARFFNKYSPCVGELDYPSLFASDPCRLSERRENVQARTTPARKSSTRKAQIR
jgi:hypothetical protein